MCGGGQRRVGTPFDDKINQAYNSWRAEQRKAQMPLVTVLRARHGVVSDFSVNPSPWPVDMPALPAELLARPVADKKPPPAPPPPKVQPLMAPSLIISGRKPATSPPPAVQVTTNPHPPGGDRGAPPPPTH